MVMTMMLVLRIPNGANSETAHSANRDISVSIVIDNSAAEKSLQSVIIENGALYKSDIVDGAHNSSLDTNL